MQSDFTIALPPAIKNPASLERRDNALGDDPEHVGPFARARSCAAEGGQATLYSPGQSAWPICRRRSRLAAAAGHERHRGNPQSADLKPETRLGDPHGLRPAATKATLSGLLAMLQYRVVQRLRVGVFKVCGRGVETGIFACQRRDAFVDAISASGRPRKDNAGWSRRRQSAIDPVSIVRRSVISVVPSRIEGSYRVSGELRDDYAADSPEGIRIVEWRKYCNSRRNVVQNSSA